MRVALVNCDPLPEPDVDEAPLLAAFADAGHEAKTVAWNTSASSPPRLAKFDCCLLRATWDYYHDLPAFLDWLDRAAEVTTVLNPPAVVQGNAHKGYLLELEQAEIPIVPTRLISCGDEVDLQRLIEQHGWSEFVIKPAVGAGSFMTTRHDKGGIENASKIITAMLKHRDVLVQEFVRSVEVIGERSVVCIAGEISHAAIKQPRFSEDEESVAAFELTPIERAFTERVLDVIGRDLLYARVDIFDNEEGVPMLSELELIEPSLYFELCPGSAERFVRAVERRLESAEG